MRTLHTRFSLTALLLLGAVPLLAAPALGFLAWLSARSGAAPITAAAGAAWAIACLAGGALYAALAVLLIRRRIDRPLAYFRSTLEDISEGFIVDRMPREIFDEAEPGITDSFGKVIGINRMLLKTVDNLEKGFEEERQAKLEQAALTRAYQRFVPQEFISYLRKISVTELKLGDHTAMEMTILVSDIRSFTALSESLTPEQNFELINAYLFEMEPVVKQYSGFIDKYMGDAIMALFHGSTDNAVQAAVGMLRRLEGFNERRLSRGEPPIRIGIGLNAGPMMLGIVGGESRMEGTVISDAVNLASRIEDLNKRYGTSLLLSEHAHARLRDPSRYGLRAIDLVQVKGKTQPVRIYELFDGDPEEVREGKRRTLAEFEAALRLLEQGRTAEAAERFARCAALAPSDSVTRYHLDRCAAVAAAGAPATNDPKAGEAP